MKKVLFIGYFGNPSEMMEEARNYFYGEKSVEYHVLNDRVKYEKSDILRRKIERCRPFVDKMHLIDSTSHDEIRALIESFEGELWAVVPKGESMLDLFSRMIPLLDPAVLTPTVESIKLSSEKKEMRAAFSEHCPALTIKSTSFSFQEAGKDVTREVRQRQFDFPVILKPNGLSTSMFVTKVRELEELAAVFDNIKTGIERGYVDKGGRGDIEIIVEEFISGRLFSIDSYVNSQSITTHAPIVQVETGVSAKRDSGYYGYLQSTPAAISSSLKDAIEGAAEQAIQAVGLKSSSAHIEFIVDGEKIKLVEIGPRPGGYRTTMYAQSQEIPHFLNDILTRVDLPVLIGKPVQAVTLMKIYPKKEGVLKEIRNLPEAVDSIHLVVVQKEVGQNIAFAQNGGLSVVDVVVKGSSVDETCKIAQQIDSQIEFIVE